MDQSSDKGINQKKNMNSEVEIKRRKKEKAADRT